MTEQAAYSRAETALEAGEHETVLRVTDELLAARPGDDAAHALRARALVALGRVGEAERHAADAVRLDPDEVAYRELLAEVRSRAGAHADAAYEYARLGRLDPRQTEWVAAEARERANAEQPETAILAARRALRLDPENAGAQLALARALVALGDRREALDAAVRAAELLPGDPQVEEVVGDAHRLAGEYRLAFGHYRGLSVNALAQGAQRERVVDKARELYRRHGGSLRGLVAGSPALFRWLFTRGWLSVS